jgi:hypothetical protein
VPESHTSAIVNVVDGYLLQLHDPGTSSRSPRSVAETDVARLNALEDLRLCGAVFVPAGSLTFCFVEARSSRAVLDAIDRVGLSGVVVRTAHTLDIPTTGGTPKL